ncbi:hypothetical protein LTR53_013912 [Teratosphaeriaceae sp. CCFEE 6253]|nr:hypothetical protein LTR53_013912 [Teratosphaeriaceae sp. CCFEE 6253]
MASPRDLPERKNPLLSAHQTPLYEILVERRCLGVTELKVKTGLVGTSNATKPENLGVLEYAHLRVPLPVDLSGSGIFSKISKTKWPENYFLMRRSSDGFISATGMFKAAFPYAQKDEEHREAEYLKETHDTASEEVAGNIWITPDQALELAEEYEIRPWIEALLDPEPIIHGLTPGKSGREKIKSPPTYRIKDMPKHNGGAVRSPEKKSTERGQSLRSRRSASVRSDEPDVAPKTPSRPKATPRKPRKGRGGLSKVSEGETPEPEVNGAAASSDPMRETVKVEVETFTELTASGAEEIERTKVNVEMPAGHPDLPLPNNPEDMIAKAREMVKEAQKVGGPAVGRGKSKRKADEMLDEDEVDAGPVAPAKKARKLEIELRKERIKGRALAGIAATLILGALVPTIAAAFGA